MSMDFLSMFASNVWNIILHKSIVSYIVTVVKMYSLNLSQHSHYEIIIIRAKLLINIVIYKYGSHFLIGSDWSIASLPWAGGGYVLLERIFIAIKNHKCIGRLRPLPFCDGLSPLVPLYPMTLHGCCKHIKTFLR
jgi:hypothetical protein